MKYLDKPQDKPIKDQQVKRFLRFAFRYWRQSESPDDAKREMNQILGALRAFSWCNIITASQSRYLADWIINATYWHQLKKAEERWKARRNENSSTFYNVQSETAN
jgi:hypothetical protein